jgi:hypothetical protein
MQRRTSFASIAGPALSLEAQDRARRVPAYEAPLFSLHDQFSTPVRIKSIEVLERDKATFVCVPSSEGATGIVRTKDIDDFLPILLHKPIPSFLGQDARDLESIIDGVYTKWYAPNLRNRNGILPVPAGHGLGVDFDPRCIEQARGLES